jgi:glycosyltransferase involved in cell wall biosynthesis
VLTSAPVPGAEVPQEPPAVDGVEVARELRWYWRDFAFPRLAPHRRVQVERHNARVLARHLGEFAPDVVTWWAMGGMSLSLIEQVRRRGLPAVGVVGDAWMVYGREVDGWTRMWAKRPRLGAVAERVTGVPARVDLSGAATWLFNSDYTRTLAGAGLARTGVVHPGVDGAAFPARPPQPWSWRLACIGRVEPPKGLAVAIDALAQLPAEATLSIVGRGDERHRAELEAQARRLGLGDRVTFTTAAPGTVADHYAAADAILFPVVWDEPWGLVPLEAMSVGRPVAGSATGGAREYLRDGENCLLAERGDPSALAAQVRRVADEPALREHLVAGGHETAARFTEDAFVEGTLDAIAQDRPLSSSR